MLLEGSIGDVIRAWRALGAADDGERRAIARLLGFDLRSEAPDDGAAGPAHPVGPPSVMPAPVTATPVAPALVVPSAAMGDPIELVPFREIRDDHRLPAEGVKRPTATRARPLESLFAASWTRAIVGTLTARAAAVGALDVDRAIAICARREPIRMLPRRDRLISASEIAVVVDRRGAMAWFRADADHLIERLDAVTHSPVRVVTSAGAPALAAATGGGGGEDEVDAGDEAAPARVRIGPGGRIIGITDLGLGARTWSRDERGRTEEWIELAQAARSRGASLVIITPVLPGDIPGEMRRAASCVHWDGRTQAALVHRLVKGMR